MIVLVKEIKKSGLPVVKAWGEHTPDSFSLRTDVSCSFVASTKVTLAVSVPKRLKGAWRELLRARKLFGKRPKNLSVFEPALTLRSGNPITRHWVMGS